ncbi:SMC-Scp complex subunit ScpB [Saccharospirillum impatiens]|uniref:SMC-Scp complex subunit ScpB n=1 Tax=Saccharospirillum impatiens TaxID=169438 RepID=UPI0004293070|nr:SMC-Scp complex subunit ScpB [Saccharospirillum impatiens]
MTDENDDQNHLPVTDGRQPVEGEDSAGQASQADQETDRSSVEDAEAEADRQPDSDPAAHDDQQLGDPESLDGESSDEAEDDADPELESGDPYGGHSPETVKHIMEGALFAAGTALSIAQIAALFETYERPHRSSLRSLMTELLAEYQGGGVELVEVASGYRFQTRHSIGAWVSRLWEERPQRYSRALLETIALIAYRQPITRSEIEDVRGVSVSTQIVRTLLEREWVRVVGHRDVPGRPAMYATTRQFLDHFGLTSLDQLPSLGEIRDLDDINPQLGLEGDDDRSVGAVDDQAEISFSTMVDKLREGERSGKTGNTFIDEQLDGELSEMDAVNDAIEQAFEAQRAGHDHPDLDLTDGDEPSQEEVESAAPGEPEADVQPSGDVESDEHDIQNSPQEPDALSEAEQWRIIQEKLAQQQALLDGRESDQPGGDDDNEH